MQRKIFAKAFAVAMSSAMVLTSSPATGSIFQNVKIIKASTNEGTEDAYVYCYAGLTWNEYWASEGVYAAGDDSTSDEIDAKGESDKGGYDVVTRATTNHGLHRGSYQCTAVINATDTSDPSNTKQFKVSHWSSDGTTIYLSEDETQSVQWSKGTITDGDTTYKMNDYEVSGIKYVPVAVKASDYDDFKAKYTVVEDGGSLKGGYGEQQLSAYAKTAEITADTNGLKTAVKQSDGSFSFSARKTGADSGIQGESLKTVDSDTVKAEVQEAGGAYGEFLRVDFKNGYGDLGANMQAVKWTYYGDDSSRTKALASYGTKFAADNWMHKSQGIQLGLTDSIRCQLPEGYDGRGYWSLTVYALGYEDYTVDFEATADNIVYDSDEEKDTSKLSALVASAKALNKADYCTNETLWSDMLSELAEAEEELAEPHSQAVIDEAYEHLSHAINSLTKHEKVTASTKASSSKDGSVVTTCSKCGETLSSTTIKRIGSVSLSRTALTYNKKAQKPSVSVKDRDGNAISADNYTVSYSNANSTNAGTYQVTVSFKGNYEGSSNLSYKINPAKGSAKLSKTAYTYNKKVQRPSVSASGIGTGYWTVSYSNKNSKKPGAYTVKVAFKGNFTGNQTLTYTIKPSKTSSKLSKAKKTSMKVSWKKVTGVSAYQIQYGTSKSFKKAKTVKVSAKSASKTLKKLKKNKKYYVRVRSYKTSKVNGKNKNLYSSWSSKKVLKTRK